MKSMTAYASTTQTYDWGTVSCDIRSVNHRYLDIQLRLPDALRALEPLIRDAIKSTVSRGKVDAMVKIESHEKAFDWEVDTQKLHRLHHAVETIQTVFPNASLLNPLDILMLPGIQQATPPLAVESKAVTQHILDSVTLSLEQLNTHRHREGSALKRLLEEKLHQMATEVALVEEHFPMILQKQTEVLKKRIEEIQGDLEESRLTQEIVYLSQKADITEEIDRLKTHLIEVQRLLNEETVLGRRLDFLMQELNREANTLGAKSIHSLLSKASVELKVLIEQMREQIQNIE